MGNDYSREDGVDLSGVYGVLKTLQYQVFRYNPLYVICVFDGKGGSAKKKKYFPDYKKNRGLPIKVNYKNAFAQNAKLIEESQKNFLYQLRLLHEFFSYLPLHRIVAEGCEADEVIGYVVKNFMPDTKKLVISMDKDFHQLLSPNVHIYEPRRRVLLDESHIKTYWKLENPNALTLYRAILGDASDKIPGIEGIKEKSVQNYFPDFMERKDINSVDDFVVYLQERSDLFKKEKKVLATNWKTVVAKCDHILTGSNSDGMKCIDVLYRNYDLMQLDNPDISIENTMTIQRYLNLDVHFNCPNYKMKIISEGLAIEGGNLSQWERNYRDLEYRQKQYKKEVAVIKG